ncbi:MAG TPA: ABC transporter ATP-binding protein [Saprospiraceae bacterium]|nr:ABC transporter ATP-binding protein [Saprospiraceae bacterium]
MEVKLCNISKRYRYQWILKDVNHTFESGLMVGIKGPNGSGKSTLMKMTAGFLSPTSGKVSYLYDEQVITKDKMFAYISFVAPYTQLIREFTIKEQFDFHFRFKRAAHKGDWSAFSSFFDFTISQNKRIENYSSGMNQRLQLALALWSDSPLLLFDEPTAYLDEMARAWFYDQLEKFTPKRTVIIASNDHRDLELAHSSVDVREL